MMQITMYTERGPTGHMPTLTVPILKPQSRIYILLDSRKQYFRGTATWARLLGPCARMAYIDAC